MSVREYRGPLGVLAAGAIGVSLLCSVSAMAMSDLENQVLVTIEPVNIVDFAVSNLNTAVANTEQAVTQFVPTATLTAVPTNTASLTPVPTDTPRRFVTITPTVPRRTRPPAEEGPPIFNPNPVRTNTPLPPLPPPADTSPPPANTPLPPPTNTRPPPPTNTEPPPPPTNTEPPPPPTNTEPPPPTEPPTIEPSPTSEPVVQEPIVQDPGSGDTGSLP